MHKVKRNHTLRKKRLGKKDNRRKKKLSRKARGYTNECVIPAPSHDRQDKKSCTQIDLQDDYGNTILSDKGLSGDKECNMYYYIRNGKYYKCRNYGKNKCNKTGKYHMKRMTCGVDSVNRLKSENRHSECVIPAPSHDRQDKESCTQIDLHDDYGNTMLTDKGLSGDKECNMYYYIHNGKYYKCRNYG